MVALSEPMFEGSFLRTIHIPRSIEAIGNLCFARCPALESVTLEEGSRLISLRIGSFRVSRLSGIQIPPIVEHVGPKI